MRHEEGQYRAELFEEFVYRLLSKTYPHPTHIVRNATFASPTSRHDSISIDFVVDTADGEIIVETKAPYTEAMSDVVARTFDRVVASVQRASLTAPVRQAIVAVPIGLSDQLWLHAKRVSDALQPHGTAFAVWDAAKLSELAALLLNVKISSFDMAELENVVGSRRGPIPLATTEDGGGSRLPIGERDDVMVLSADFCSFTAFVHASGPDTALITSVMGRFYRETRDAIASSGGTLDKFIGDGILCYWFDPNSADALEACVSRLVGIAVNIAEEWQDQIDLSVTPKGLRAGAAIGSVLFIEERSGEVHAIGESINMSARLQSAAEPNMFVITNRLRGRHFGDKDYESLGTIILKNIGPVVAWRRSVVMATGA